MKDNRRDTTFQINFRVQRASHFYDGKVNIYD